MPETEKSPLRERLKQQSHWTTQEIQQLILDEFLVEYSLRQVSRLLREMKLYFYKPFQLDEKRPLEAESMLTQALLEAFQKLQSKGVDLTRVAIGFGDECSPQTAPNTARFWSVFKQPRKVLTTKIRRNTFGFYTLRGNDCIFEIESSKAVQFVDVLSVIKEPNQEFYQRTESRVRLYHLDLGQFALTQERNSLEPSRTVKHHLGELTKVFTGFEPDRICLENSQNVKLP